jgi:predicted metal-binding membrane protein
MAVLRTTATPRPTGTTRTAVWPRAVVDAPWIAVTIGAAWLLAVAAQLSGQAGLLHHHHLIGDGALPLWLAALAFLGSWQVMVAGMMLPASLPAIRAFTIRRASGRGASAGTSVVGFLLAYVLVWTAFGIVAFFGDAELHRTVHATPWLAQRQWLIEAGVLVLAGAYQFLPWKRRGLAACRHPAGRVSGDGSGNGPGDGGGEDGFAAGFRHGVDCLASSWALMLLMFAAGFANLAWMAILAAVMAYEAAGRHGQRVASVFGLVLLALAIAVVWSGLAGSPALASVV